jgi:hypothetical protein
MTELDRSAILYARHLNAGATVDWRTGRVRYPKAGPEF